MAIIWSPPGGESSLPNPLDSPVTAAATMVAPAIQPHMKRRKNMAIELKGVIAEHIRAVNAFDTDAIMATFAVDAYVNDNRREIAGIDAIRRWVEKEIVGDRVTLDVREVIDHYGDTIVRAAYDGEYDKTNLPKVLIMTDYFSVRDGKIVSLAIIFNQPSPY
jgi:hypothetical protein